MQGIYIHIPYCKKVCYYCDFHFSVSLKNRDKLIQSIVKEIESSKNYLDSNILQTIYFGGGTPSVLNKSELETLFNAIYKYFSVAHDAEVTFEANPDDLTNDYIRTLHDLTINRLSIGVQSFHDKDLTWMNRRHNSVEAEQCIKKCQDGGFDNINIDLIYGLPTLTIDLWRQNLEKFISLEIPHLSAYHLTIEPKTVLGIWKKRGNIKEIPEEESLREFALLLEITGNNGYEHYEISNFCKDEKYSKHNLNYWQQGKYLGVGPSAHSYDGKSRQWNIALNDSYIHKMEHGLAYFEREILSKNDQFNDYLLTHLRTKWGVRYRDIRDSFGNEYLNYFENELNRFDNGELVETDREGARLTNKGKLVADRVITALMKV